MTAPVLFVSSYAESEPIGGNRTVAAQALQLSNSGVNVEVLTWPNNDTWRGPTPGPSDGMLGGVPYRVVKLEKLRYHVVTPPIRWAYRFLSPADWSVAVSWATEALTVLNPSVVHLQFWQNLTWVMHAAVQLGIPTVYSIHDYGMACHRTILITGTGDLCDAKPMSEKCAKCVISGRGLLGRANELVVRVPLARSLLDVSFGKDENGWLARKGCVRSTAITRTELVISRARYLFSHAAAVIAASPVAATYASSLGALATNIHLLPWFHHGFCGRGPSRRKRSTRELSLGYIGRLSPEKGVHILLRALTLLKDVDRLTLHIAGVADSDYGRSLLRQFSLLAGRAHIRWHGWVSPPNTPAFFSEIDVSVLPSLSQDNCPLSLVESIASGCPVICSDVPSMTHLVKQGVNGWVFPMGDSKALAHVIHQIAVSPEVVEQFAERLPPVMDIARYATELATIYESIAARNATGAVRGPR